MTKHQIEAAIDYNRRRFEVNRDAILAIQSHVVDRWLFSSDPKGRPGVIDEAFVQAVADWQDREVAGSGTGRVNPWTEARCNIETREGKIAAARAQAIFAAGEVLFDAWDMDGRDNDNSGKTDTEPPDDGSHYYDPPARSFTVHAGEHPIGAKKIKVKVAETQVIHGNFKYRVCADIVSEAYKAADVMAPVRSVEKLIQSFKRKGYIFQRSTGYPTEYLPGDLICVFDSSMHEGHAGIVISRSETMGGSNAPMVVELPGPTAQAMEGAYHPKNRSDLQCHPWPALRTSHPADKQFLGRLLYSKLRGHPG